MRKFQKILLKVLSGDNDKNIRFEDIRYLLDCLGFRKRIKGSHIIFTKNDIEEIINLQPDGHLTKPYQVRQVRSIITKYSLGGNDE